MERDKKKISVEDLSRELGLINTHYKNKTQVNVTTGPTNKTCLVLKNAFEYVGKNAKALVDYLNDLEAKLKEHELSRCNHNKQGTDISEHECTSTIGSEKSIAKGATTRTIQTNVSQTAMSKTIPATTSSSKHAKFHITNSPTTAKVPRQQDKDQPIDTTGMKDTMQQKLLLEKTELQEKIKNLTDKIRTLEDNLFDSSKFNQELKEQMEMLSKSHKTTEVNSKERRKEDEPHDTNDQQEKNKMISRTNASKQNEKQVEKRTMEDPMQHENSKLKEQIQGLNNQLFDEQKKSKEMKERMEILSKRLSEELSTKVSASESNIENISILCRPMNIADDYRNLITYELHDVQEKYGTENHINMFWCSVFMEVQKVTREVYLGVKAVIYDISRNPFVNEYQKKQKNSPAETDLSQEVLIALSDTFRKNVAKTDVSYLIKIASDRIKQEKLDNKTLEMLQSEEGRCLLKSICELSWKMVIQRPPMLFKKQKDGSKYDPSLHELAWGSDDKKGHIKSVHYPALYHGESLVVKAKVLVN